MSLDIEKIAGLHLCNPKDGETLHVLRNGNFCIGRAQDNDLAVADLTVSAHHASIYTYLTASYIEDLGSTNGTFVNGKRISKHVLKAGDVIRMGAYVLQLQQPVGEAEEMETNTAAV